MQLALIVLSAALWGVTNPFIRRASAGIENIQAGNFLAKTFLEFKFLFTNINVNIHFWGISFTWKISFQTSNFA